MGESLLPPSLASDVRFVALEKIYRQRIAALDLAFLVPRFVDAAPLAMLPFLAEEFGVVGTVAWRRASDAVSQRRVIRQGILMHKLAGTVWALEEALRQLEIEPTVLEWFTTGAPRATFSISADCFTQSVTPDLYSAVEETALRAKNARSLLTGVQLISATRGAAPMLGAVAQSAVVTTVLPKELQ